MLCHEIDKRTVLVGVKGGSAHPWKTTIAILKFVTVMNKAQASNSAQSCILKSRFQSSQSQQLLKAKAVFPRDSTCHSLLDLNWPSTNQ